MKRIVIVFFSLIAVTPVFAQNKNFIDMPYVETTASVDTLVTPDKIYLSILLMEQDTKGKISVEALEEKMAKKLTALGVDLKKQLATSDISSSFKKYFLKQQDVLKSKSYSLLVYDAKTAMEIMVALEGEGISNISIEKTEFSGIESLKLQLKSHAVKKAKDQALAMVKPLDQKVGNAIFISDQGSVYYMDEAMPMAMSARGVMNKSVAYESLDIEFKKIKVDMRVSVKFQLQ